MRDFQTVEQVNPGRLQVLKRDGRVVRFDRKSVERSMRKAVVHGHKPEELAALVDAVVDAVYGKASGGAIPSSVVAEAVLKTLRQRDPAWQIRFALVQYGRRDRTSGDVSGWTDIGEVRRWLLEEYPQLRHYRPASRLEKVVKRDGRREPFDRRKLERSIGTASKGRGSRDRVHQRATAIADIVERALGDQPLVTSGQISAEILRQLRVEDHVAYLRYASTAKGFTSPEDYEDEANGLRAVDASGLVAGSESADSEPR